VDDCGFHTQRKSDSAHEETAVNRSAEEDERAVAAPAWEDALEAADPTAPEKRFGALAVELVPLALVGVSAPFRPEVLGVLVAFAGLVPVLVVLTVELSPGALAGPERWAVLLSGA